MKKLFKYKKYTEPGDRPEEAVTFEAQRPRVVCGWCDILIRPGNAPESHGICSDCLKHQLEFVKKMEPFELASR